MSVNNNSKVDKTQVNLLDMPNKKYKNALHIFRRDYRIVDNTALNIASKCASDGVIPIFIFTYRQIKANPLKSNNCVQFLVESLEDLRHQITESGGKLYIYYTTDEYKLIKQILLKNPGIGVVSWNRDYTKYSEDRDAKIKEMCLALDRDVITPDDHLLHPLGTIVTGTKSQPHPYTKYTPFMRATLSKPIAKPDLHYKPKFVKLQKSPAEYGGKLSAFHDNIVNINLPEKGGRKNGLNILNNLREWKTYDKNRDQLIYKTTHLSPFNKFGCISVREAYWRMRDSLGVNCGLIRQLAWRDFFYNLSATHTYIYTSGAMNKKWENIGWSEPGKNLDIWIKGKTGFPIVDAAMREIAETGYMHNRARLISANFLTRLLSIDWRRGERYFAAQLYDYDPAQNSFGWQLNAAVSGTESRPLNQTILNPWIPSVKYDHDAQYIKKWLPELSEIPPGHLHRWDKYGGLYVDKIKTYPCVPIINYDKAKQENLKIYKQVKY